MSMTHQYKLLSNLDGDNLAADFLSQPHSCCPAVAMSCLWLVQLLNRMQTKRDRQANVRKDIKSKRAGHVHTR